MLDWLIDGSAWVMPVVLAITLHEAAHGWVALKFGDDTAQRMGRVTFNPFRHIDKFGTVLFPAILLLMRSPIIVGYAKPVPVDFTRLNPPRRGMMAVALAGVAMNFALAIVAGLLLHLESVLPPEQAPWLFLNIYRLLIINCVLIAFNLLPILPLDGGRVVDSVLSGKPKHWFGKLERYGIVIVLATLLLPPFFGYNLAGYVIGVPAFWLLEQVLWLTGNGQ